MYLTLTNIIDVLFFILLEVHCRLCYILLPCRILNFFPVKSYPNSEVDVCDFEVINRFRILSMECLFHKLRQASTRFCCSCSMIRFGTDFPSFLSFQFDTYESISFHHLRWRLLLVLTWLEINLLPILFQFNMY